MRKALSLTLAVLLCLSLAGGAFASGEASGNSAMPNMSAGSGTAAYTVSDEGLTVDESVVTVTRSDAAVETAEQIAGIRMDSDDNNATGINFTGTGLLSIGGEDTPFTVETYFTGEELSFNTVINLTESDDYVWGTDSTGGIGIGVRSAGTVTMDRVYALDTGVGRYSLSLSKGTTIIKNCYFESVGCDAEYCDMPWFTAQLGNARNVIACGTLSAYIYNSVAASEGYGSWSTDTGGSSFNFYLYNGDALNYYGGYGTYADTGLEVFVYGSRFDSAEYGAFCTNTGILNIGSSSDALGASDEIFLENLQSQELAEDTPSEIIGDRNAIVFHVVDTMHSANPDTGVKDSSVSTSWKTTPVLNVTNSILSTIGATGEAVQRYPVLQQAWHDHLRGATIVFRGACGYANLENTRLESSTGVLILTCVDCDESTIQILDDVATEDIPGACVNSVNNDWTGDIRNEDYQRPLRLDFTATTLTGAIITTGVDEWNALWADYADVSYVVDPETGWYVNADDPTDTDASYKAVDPGVIYSWLAAFESYDAVRGTFLTMDADSVWNVTAESQLVSLETAPGAVINGIVTVDGETIDPSLGGSWQGEIVVVPSEPSASALVVDGEEYITLSDAEQLLSAGESESVYGYPGEVDLSAAETEAANVSSGELVLDGRVISYMGGTAVQDTGTSVVVARNSYIKGDTEASTEPLTGNPGNLLVAGSIRTTLAMGQSHAFYINSTIVSKNWAALSTDGAEPALEEGESELSLFAYGTDAITEEGGYGAYSDLFCNLYSYGSRIRSAEIGIISGTYGRVVIGTIADGEADEELASYLTEEDKALRPDKTLGSVIEGGRNALMVHSVNLPPYWEYEGYSEEELPLYSTEITAADSVLATDLSLDQGVVYEGDKQGYIDHSAGSVILIKSTNLALDLTRCELLADPDGTGAVIHTVYNNDTGFMNAVPDGEQYPGSVITMTEMTVTGDVLDEDYQRDLTLVLSATQWDGAINYYDCDHWNAVAAAEGFTTYAMDESYAAVHGSYVELKDGSTWTVTGESTLLGLVIGEGCTVNGTMTVDGVATDPIGGEYTGVIVLLP